MKMKFTALSIVGLAVAALGLVACSGGGGGSTPPAPTSVTVTCPNGTTQTAATTELANTACPAPILVFVTPVSGSLTASPDSFTGIQVTTDSVLDPASLTTTNVTLKVGSLTTVSGTVSATDTKGFKFVPTAKLQYGQTYNFVATVKDMVGKILTVNSTFTTAYVTCTLPQVPNSTGTACVDPASACTAPAVWTSGVNACVTPIDLQVVGMNQIPSTAIYIGETDWLRAVSNGTVKFIDTGAVMTGFSTRPIVWAFFKSWTGDSCTRLMYKDDGNGVNVPGVNNNTTEGIGCNTSPMDWVVGTQSGIIRHFLPEPQFQRPNAACYQLTWNQSRVGFDDLVVACPF